MSFANLGWDTDGGERLAAAYPNSDWIKSLVEAQLVVTSEKCTKEHKILVVNEGFAHHPGSPDGKDCC